MIDMPLGGDGGGALTLNANALTQQVVCYLERTAKLGIPLGLPVRER